MLEILYVRLAPIVYDLLDIMLLMPGIALLMISEILIACNFSTKYHKRNVIDYIY